jgi:hypothetical protein
MKEIADKYAPIVLFCYKRLDTLIQTVEALQKNYLAAESDLIIFSDAAKNNLDKLQVNAVREYIKNIEGFNSVEIHCAEANKGLATSIIDGVSLVLNDHEFVIALEDDLETTPNFLDFMNSSLNTYASEEKVFSISGYSFALNLRAEQGDVYFLNRGWSWGWATWKSRWDKVDWDVKEYSTFSNDRKRKKDFAKGGSDLNQMLKKQMNGRLDSWAIRWFFNQFLICGLTLYPNYSLVNNIGFGNEATHTKGSNKRYRPELNNGTKRSFEFPSNVELSKEPQKEFLKKMGYLSRIKSRLTNMLGNV